MSNWTSISVKEAQKAELNEAKDEIDHNGSMGEFLVESVNGTVDTAEPSVDIEGLDELQETLEELDTENVGRTAVQVSKLQEEIGRLQDQVNQLEKTLEGLR